MKHVDGRMQVLVGTMNAYTPNAVRYSREAEELGADGLMIMPPYYYTPTEDEIFAYYKAISRGGLDPDHALQQPVHLERRHVGEAGRPADRRRSRRSATSRRRARTWRGSTTSSKQTKGVMNVFAGERIVESFLLGAVGYVNPYRQLHPARLDSRIWDFSSRGRIEDAKRSSADHARSITSSPRAIRPTATSAIRRRWPPPPGYPVGDVRPPLTTLRRARRGRRAAPSAS